MDAWNKIDLCCNNGTLAGGFNAVGGLPHKAQNHIYSYIVASFPLWGNLVF